MNEFSIVIFITVIFLVIVLFKTARVVPQRKEYVIERLGKYSRTLSAEYVAKLLSGEPEEEKIALFGLVSILNKNNKSHEK